jgi:hypothetical protein
MITHVWNRGPITTGYCMPLYFLYSLHPPPVRNLVPCPHICIRSSCACLVKSFEKISHYRMHDVTFSAAVTSFGFLVSEIFNGNTPPKTYTCQKQKKDFNAVDPQHIHENVYISIRILYRL